MPDTRDPADTARGRRLYDLRLEAGLTQEEVGRAIGVGHAYVSRLERGERPLSRLGGAALTRLAELLGTTPDGLLNVAGAPLPRHARGPADVLEAALRQIQSVRPVDVPMMKQRLGAGTAFGTADPEYVTIVPGPEQRGHDLAAARVSGECMVPDVMPGHIAVFDRDAEWSPGDLVVAEVEGEMHLKWVEERVGELWLTANQGFKPVRLSKARIEGVVIGLQYQAPRKR